MSNVPFLGPLWFPTFVDAVQRRDLNAPIGPLKNGGATHIANKRCSLRADRLGIYIIICTPATPGGVYGGHGGQSCHPMQSMGVSNPRNNTIILVSRIAYSHALHRRGGLEKTPLFRYVKCALFRTTMVPHFRRCCATSGPKCSHRTPPKRRRHPHSE